MKRWKPTAVITLAALALAGCAAGMTVSQRAYVACSGYTAALSALAVHKAAGRLSGAVIRRVDQARAVVNPLCGQAVTHIKVHHHAAGAQGGNQEMARTKGG